MNAAQLKHMQQPLKQEYRERPESAVAKLKATGNIDIQKLSCCVDVPLGKEEQISSGLHPKAGGDGRLACSGDMLLQSLVACSGVTFAAVATSMELDITSAKLEAIGVMDFRGTLGIDRETPIGLTTIELNFEVDTNEPDEKIDKLIQLTERYCVVLQTIAKGTSVSSRRN